MKTLRILALLVCVGLAAAAHAQCSYPAGYVKVGDVNYVEGTGIGHDIPTCLAYQYPGTDYSSVNLYYKTTGASSCAVLPNIGQIDDQSFNANLITVTAANGSHECYVTVPNTVAGFPVSYSFNGCDGSSCSPFNFNASGGGGWSSAPLGSNISSYCLPSGSSASGGYGCNLPLPSAGTPVWSMMIESDPAPAPGHTSLAGMTGVLESGTAPPYVSYTIEVDGTPCTAALGGCTVNDITVQVQCGNPLVVRAASNDWNVETPLGSDFWCGNTPIGYLQATTADQIVYTPSSSASGAHAISIVAQGLTTGNGNDGATVAGSFTFTVTAPTSLPYTPPSSWPALPSIACPGAGTISSLACWLYHIAGTGNLANNYPGYLLYANQWLAAERTTPGEFFNDASSATLWDIPPYAIMFYDVGRFPEEFGDALANCHSSSAVTPCTNWAASTPVTAGQLLDTGSCVLDVTTAGTTGGSAPTCPASCTGSAPNYASYGCLVSDGSAAEASLAEAQQWYQWAQNEGDQFRNSKMGIYYGYGSQEWDLHSVALAERYFRRNGDTLDANAVACLLHPFVVANGCTYDNKLVYDGYTPYGTVRALPLNLIALDMQWRITGVKPLDTTTGVDLIQRWSDILAQVMRKTVTCAPAGNITAGWPNCANNVMLSSQNFDGSLEVQAAKETIQVEDEKGTVDTALLSALYHFLDWVNYYQYAPLVSNFGIHSMAYTMFGFPRTTSQVDFQQSQLSPMMADGFAFLGAWCNNCTLPLSGVAAWTIADDYSAHAFDNAAMDGKKYAQAYEEWLAYLHHRTNPANGGWTAVQSEAAAALNPYDSTFPNLLGPYMEGTWPNVASNTSGTVNTSGVAVTWVSGIQFDPSWYGQTLAIGATKYGIAAVNSATSITLGSSAGTQTAANYSMPTPACGGSASAGAFTCTWYSAPTASTGVRLAVSPSDPYSAGTLYTGGAGTGCNTNSNLCLNVVSGSSAAAGAYNVAFVGTDSAGNTATTEQNWNGGDYAVTITNAGPTITMTPAAPLPSGTVGTPYSVSLSCSGGTGPYSWAQTFGGVAGVSINASTGVYAGTPTTAGVFEVSLRCTDSLSNSANVAFPNTTIGASPSAVPAQMGGAASIGGAAVLQ